MDKNLQKIAHEIVSDSIKNKILIPQSCEICGRDKTDAHHDDYTKPLQVRWLCRKHHIDFHLGKPLHKEYTLNRKEVVQTLVIEFKKFIDKRAALSTYGFEKELKLPINTISKALSGERKLPKKHMRKLYDLMKHYGYGKIENENYIL